MAGIALDDSSFPSFAMSFVLPPDYTPGLQFFIELTWPIDASGCEVNLFKNFDSIARAGEPWSAGDLQGVAAQPSPGVSVVTTTSFIWPPGAFGAEPGDAINVGFWREVSDSCGGTLTVHGARVIYR